MNRLMKRLLQRGELTETMIAKVAKKIAMFHSHAERSSEIDTYGDITTIKYNTDENFLQTEKYINKTITQTQYDAIMRYTNTFYKKNSDVFLGRIQNGRIKDCHGDLHMEHICITDDDIIIFDCIEFNKRFRYSDTTADIAFLAMDLDYYGRKDLSERLMHHYIAQSKDKKVNGMLTFYKIYRAYVRGKVNSFRLDDPSINEKEKNKAITKAKRYFDLTYSYVRGK